MSSIKDILNCPNCGAPIQNDICPYCGSVFLDWAAFDIQKPTFVKVKDWNGHYQLMKISTMGIRFNFGPPEEACLYADNRVVYQLKSLPEVTIEGEFRCIPFIERTSGKEVLSITIDPDTANENDVKTVMGGNQNER